MEDRIQHLLEESCARCKWAYICQEAGELEEKCDLCPLEAQIRGIAAVANLVGQIEATRDIIGDAIREAIHDEA